eukprot:7257411-Pyramimonas_sp.AAC.1
MLQFKIEDGWDFSKHAVTRNFLDKINIDKLDDIFFAPPRKYWRSWLTFLKMIPTASAKQQNGTDRRTWKA